MTSVSALVFVPVATLSQNQPSALRLLLQGVRWPVPKMKKVPINKDEYSEESKRSVGHEFLGNYYEDIKYSCSKCKKTAIFLAEDQKQAYEVRKEYMWAKRQLCDMCWQEMRTIKADLLRVEREYCENKPIALSNKAFLAEWLELLELYPKYGKKANSARIDFVKKHLTSLSI